MVQTTKSNTRYVMDLIHAGADGAASARRAAGAPPVFNRSTWVPAAVGAAAGVATATLANRRRSNYGLAVAGLVGAAFGFGCGMAWASRTVLKAIARDAARNISTVRDARWLEKNPIDYA